MARIIFRNEDNAKTMATMAANKLKADIILTSPPYNTGGSDNSLRARNNYCGRYDVFLDDMTDVEYAQWTSRLFTMFNIVLAENGVILYNISYGNESPNSMWLALATIMQNTDFMIADTIIWKKKSALPNNASPNKLTRITEFVFVICRKSEYSTYRCNKNHINTSARGQLYYENIVNFIEAPNNDGAQNLNKATYSSELCEKLLNIYADHDCVVYDPFMGTGTTALACERFGVKMCLGSEISIKQVEYSRKRIEQYRHGR